MANQDQLLRKVNQLLGKDYTFERQIVTIEDLVEMVEQYKLQETILLERLKKQTLQIKEMKQNSRLTRFYEMAEENLKMAQELAQLKGEVTV
ncbi:hypothetical protein [Neobacillus massiliamazoniensis]|uniref:Uncharacterized protein n=1 Tax=Neobacillus massiliamazoniensis TaxID=1499688 RepID=A0A0U1NQL9_9BACI|nr:hypothetical protein [Neobacillus massiliamazoniensis]CRK80336.1 hypothetical protein BN000_00217 [Neobacillus massiliamazoniensis]